MKKILRKEDIEGKGDKDTCQNIIGRQPMTF